MFMLRSMTAYQCQRVARTFKFWLKKSDWQICILFFKTWICTRCPLHMHYVESGKCHIIDYTALWICPNKPMLSGILGACMYPYADIGLQGIKAISCCVFSGHDLCVSGKTCQKSVPPPPPPPRTKLLKKSLEIWVWSVITLLSQ